MGKTNSKFNTFLRPDGICQCVVKPGSCIDIQDALENSRRVEILCGNKRPPMLVDITGIHSITKDARDHFAMHNRNPGVTAIGLLIQSPVSRVIGNFYLGLSRPVVPTRIFTSEKNATRWLLKFLSAYG